MLKRKPNCSYFRVQSDKFKTFYMEVSMGGQKKLFTYPKGHSVSSLVRIVKMFDRSIASWKPVEPFVV